MGTDGLGEALLVSGGIAMANGEGMVLRLRCKQPLQVDVGEISISSGGTQTLVLDAPAELAGNVAIVLGTVSGTSPGFSIDGQLVPIHIPDPYFDYTLAAPNSPPLQNSLSVLDAGGDTSAAIVIPAGAPAVLVGLTFHHAAVTFDLVAIKASFASNARALTLVP